MIVTFPRVHIKSTRRWASPEGEELTFLEAYDLDASQDLHFASADTDLTALAGHTHPIHIIMETRPIPKMSKEGNLYIRFWVSRYELRDQKPA